MADSKKIRILFLAAGPSDQSRLLLEDEGRAIEKTIRSAEYRDAFEIKHHFGTRVSDLQQCLMQYKPDIVHFSGYGSEASEIILLGDTGAGRPVSRKALGKLFKLLKGAIRCVVLNSGHSGPLARVIARHIDCVIGMSRATTDQTAINFADCFYRALAYGKSVKTAFELGCSGLDLKGRAETGIPELLASADPDQVIITDTSTATSARRFNRVKRYAPRIPEPPSPPQPPIRKPILPSSALLPGILLLAAIVWLLGSQYYGESSDQAGATNNRNHASKPAQPFDIWLQRFPALETSPIGGTLLKAVSDLREGNYETVITNCSALLKNDPNQPQANLLLGETYYQTHNPKSLPLLAKAISLGETAILPVKHHHYGGLLRVNDDFCSGYLILRKGLIKFHSEDVSSEDFSVEPDQIQSLKDEAYKEGRLHLEVAITKGSRDIIETYNFYPPLAALRQFMTRTKVSCETKDCQTASLTLYGILQRLKG